MSILKSNITDEERLSGFSISEPGDETFAASDMGTYPGVFPEFEYEEEPLIPSESAFEDDGFEDSFDEFEDIPEYSEDDFENFEDNTNDSLDDNVPARGAFEDSDDDFSSFEDSEVNDNNSFYSDEIETLSDEEINELGGNSNNNVIQLDDDLKSLLEADLSHSKSNSYANDDDIEVVYDENFPIDEEKNANEFEFNTIEADRPSTIGIEEVSEENVLNNITNSEEKKFEPKFSKKDKVKSEESNKNRRLFYLIGIVASILLVSLFTTYLIFDGIFNEDKDISSKKDKKEIVHKKLAKKKSNKQEISIKSKSQIDSGEIEIEDEINDSNIVLKEDASQSIAEDKSQNEHNKSIERNSSKTTIPIEKEEVKFNTKNNQNINKNERKVSIPRPKNDYSSINNETFQRQTKSNSNRITSKNKNDENKNLIASASNIRNENISETKLPYPKKEMSDEGLFKVQVYASQSKEDAMFWLKKLKNQNVKDAEISEQLIRDEIWYRVRFGSFKDKNSAIEYANKLGYAQMWVDRVK